MAAVLAESGLEQTDEFNGQFTDVFNKSEQSVASYRCTNVVRTLLGRCMHIGLKEKNKKIFVRCPIILCR